ncbi:murein biosynthesis integral membrane protein MurJ [Corynebacterium sp. H78]|uniref:murein biosynthesis integral membrane protein MurJ n=1 Tax=Corynebacterium sp. H78 TaxID=3133417 RepID=UPI0030A96039
MPATTSTVATANDESSQSDSDVVRSTGSMAIATLISRITGFLRNALIGITLGPAVASAFNTANTLPNLITEIVLGAVLTSLVVPVLVRAEKEDPDRGAAFIRRLLTVSLSLLAFITVVTVIGAPILTRVTLDADGKVNVPLSTAFAFLLLPQIIFYGVFSLLMAVLNTKGVFKPGAWAPVANNIIAIATLAVYWLIPGSISETSEGSLSDPHILLLGIGTTLGVVVQALIMIPPLRRAGIDLRPLWGIDDRIKQFGSMGIAIVAYVAVSQLGYVITTRIASMADAAAPTVYQQHWLLLQVPYGIIGVTLLTAIMPRLSRNAADGNDRAVVRDLSVGTRLTMLALIPIVVFFTIFGQPIAIALFAYGNFDVETAKILGWTLSFSAFSLLPYAVVLLHLRVFYAREEAWTPTFIILGITFVKIVLSMAAPLVASSGKVVVVLLGAANGFGFAAGAVIGYLLLRRTLGNLQLRSVVKTTSWALIASIIGGGVAWVLGRFTMKLSEMGEPGTVTSGVGMIVSVAICGVVFLIVTGIVLSRSNLDEVRTVGGMLGRIPGLRRFAPSPSKEKSDQQFSSDSFAADGFTAAPMALVGESAGLAGEGFTASPLMPPMPTDASRPTRFVPGEIVMGGRFRLRSEQGTRPGIRYWRATDQMSPNRDEVALVFIDTLALPYTGLMPVEAARDIASRAQRLMEIEAPGIASIRSAAASRTDVLISADWVPGIAFDALAQTPNPDAAAIAVATLSEAAGAAHEKDASLGLKHTDALRISTAGDVVLAFPTPLPGSTPQSDMHCIGDSLQALTNKCQHVPSDIRQLLDSTRQPVEQGAAAKLAHDLRKVAFGPDSEEFQVISSDTDAPSDPAMKSVAQPLQHERAPKKLLLSTSAIVIASVIVIALLATAAFAWLNRSDDAPLTPDSVKRGPQVAEEKIGERVVKPASVAEWQAQNPNPQAGPDNPQSAANATDEDPATAWESSQYFEQFGPTAFKPGIGVLLEFDEDISPEAVEILGSPDAELEIRTLTDGTNTDLTTTTVIGKTTLTDKVATVSLNDAPASRYLLIWVTKLPESSPQVFAPVSIAEVVVKQ